MASTASAIDLPFDEAIAFFRDKANVTTKTWSDVYGAAHSRAFMVAGAATDALVADFRAEIDKALAEGTTLAEFRKGFDVIVKKHGWAYRGSRGWRTRIIFDTNLRTAYAAGRHAQLTQSATLEAFPLWQYNHSGALHPRREHLAWDGLALPADDRFWQTNYPPNGWHCGCFVIPLSIRDLKRQGKSGPDEAPELVFRAEEVGGVTRRVPLGVDPGFEYNPGAAWASRTGPGAETVAAAPGVIMRFVGWALAGGAPAGSYIPVAKAPAKVAAGLGAPEGSEIRLSAETVRQHVHHGEADAQAYAMLPELAIGDGAVLKDDQGRVTALVLDDGGRIWRMGLKRTAEDEVYITTLHYSNAKQAGRIAGRSKVLRKGKRAPGGSAGPR